MQTHAQRKTKCTQKETERRAHQRYLSTIQAATTLNISPRTLERWRIEGKGPNYRKFGKRVTYCESSLLEWAENQTHTSTSDAV